MTNDWQKLRFEECKVYTWTYGHNWIEIAHCDYGYTFDSNLLNEEIGFENVDDLLVYMELNNLLGLPKCYEE